MIHYHTKHKYISKIPLYESVYCTVYCEQHNKKINLLVQAETCHWRWKAQSAKRGNLLLLSLSMHEWVQSMYLLERCPSLSELLALVQVSPIDRAWCTEELHLWGYADKKKSAVCQTYSAKWKREGEWGMSVPLCNLCCFVWRGTSGITLAGTMKVSGERLLWMTCLRGTSTGEWDWHFWMAAKSTSPVLQSLQLRLHLRGYAT